MSMILRTHSIGEIQKDVDREYYIILVGKLDYPAKLWKQGCWWTCILWACIWYFPDYIFVDASTPFQFNSPAPQQQQSNGLFKFGGSNVPQSNVTTENNKSGMFVFGGNKPETNSQPVAPVGFNFGAAPSAGPTFNFG